MEEILDEEIRVLRFTDGLRKIRERMLRDLDCGGDPNRIALSENDLEHLTGSTENNNHLFVLAFKPFAEKWLSAARYETGGKLETKFLPKN